MRDFQQIAGRAGRKGFDERGSVVVQAPEHVIENLKLADKKAQGKKVVMQEAAARRATCTGTGRPSSACSSGRPSRSSRASPSRTACSCRSCRATVAATARLVQLIARSHSTDWGKRQLRRTTATLFRSLRRAGLIDVVLDERARHPLVDVSPELQHDFSLNHTLSIYLVETVEMLDRRARPTRSTSCRWSSRSSRTRTWSCGRRSIA